VSTPLNIYSHNTRPRVVFTEILHYVVYMYYDLHGTEKKPTSEFQWSIYNEAWFHTTTLSSQYKQFHTTFQLHATVVSTHFFLNLRVLTATELFL